MGWGGTWRWMVAAAICLQSAAHGATLKVGSVEATPGTTVEVTVEATGIKGMKALQIGMTYDADVLSPEKVETDPRVSGLLLMSNLDEKGWLAFDGASGGAIAGEGPVARVRFKVIGQGGQSSKLVPSKCRLWDGSGTEVYLALVPGEVKVVRAIPWMWIAIGAGVLLLIVGGRLASRRKPAPASLRPAPSPPRGQASPTPSAAAPTPSATPPMPLPAVTARCAKCGAEVKAEAKFCGKCGATRGGPAKCAKCGAEMSADLKFCEQCGAPRGA